MTLSQTISLARRIAHAISFDNMARPPVLIKTTDAKTRAAVFLTDYSHAMIRVAVYNNTKKTRIVITYNGVTILDWVPQNMFVTIEMIICGACKAVGRYNKELPARLAARVTGPFICDKLRRAEAFWSGRTHGPDAWETEGTEPSESHFERYIRTGDV